MSGLRTAPAARVYRIGDGQVRSWIFGPTIGGESAGGSAEVLYATRINTIAVLGRNIEHLVPRRVRRPSNKPEVMGSR